MTRTATNPQKKPTPFVDYPAARGFALVGEHAPACERAGHEDWQHGTHGCAVGDKRGSHCKCKAHWIRVR